MGTPGRAAAASHANVAAGPGRSVLPSVHAYDSECVERLLETVGVRALRLGQRLEPVGDLLETLLAGRLRHARIHVGVLVRLTGDGSLQVHLRGADRQPRRRITDLLEVFALCVRMPRLTFRISADPSSHVVYV